MLLKDAVKIFKVLNKKAVSIIEVDSLDEVVHYPGEYDTFAVVRDQDSKVIRMKNDEKENLIHFAHQLKMTQPSNSILATDGWYVCPVKAGQSEFHYLEIVNDETLSLSEEPLFVMGDVVTSENITEWSDYPCTILNEGFYKTRQHRWVCESGFRVTAPDGIQKLKIAIGFLDKIRRERISLGNTIINNLYHLLGKKEYDRLKEDYGIDKDPMKSFNAEFKNITQFIISEYQKKNPGKEPNINERVFNKYQKNGSPLIPDYYIYNYLAMHAEMQNIEDRTIAMIKSHVHEHPMWERFFEGIDGCGELSAAYILAKLDPFKARHPSAFVRYAGMDVRRNEETGKDEGTNKSHTRPTVFIDKNGEVKVTNTLGYDPILKSRILGILVPSFIKCRKGVYCKMYYDFKNYYANRPDLQEEFKKGKGKSAHKMAIRKVGYCFLVDTWKAWRQYYGLPLNGGSYGEAKLKIIHNYDRPYLDHVKE